MNIGKVKKTVVVPKRTLKPRKPLALPPPTTPLYPTPAPQRERVPAEVRR